MQNRPEILLIGGGGHCKSVIDVIEQEGKYTIVGIVDKKELLGTKVLNYEVIACDNDLESLFQKYKYACVTVGQIQSNSLRVKLFTKLKDIGFTLPAIISPLAYLSKYATLDEGTVVHHHALINSAAKIGKNCIINSKALIEHDVRVGDHCHISTAAVVNGGVVIENGSFFGSNATSKEYVEIEGFVKAGSVVK
jgi:sugar O-acyltransferase (sialic acid O-acetyltransferase NeuD family)